MVHGLHGFAGLRPARHIGLVCDHDPKQAEDPQTVDRLSDTGKDLHLAQVVRGVGDASLDVGPNQHAVPVEEDRTAWSHRIDSHFVPTAFSDGCETSRCQITAWKASEWGVTVSTLTVGTMTQASATFAV